MKRCTKCHKWKSRPFFYRNKRTRDGLRSECIICYRSSNRTPERLTKLRRRSKTRRKDIRLWIRSMKDGPCTDCRVRYPFYIMQFDHVRGKKRFNIAHARTYSDKVILDEIAKCDLVCANCHAKRTYLRRQHGR